MSRTVKIRTDCNPFFLTVNDGSGEITVYADRNAFPTPPAAAGPQAMAIDNSTGGLYCSFNGSWCFMLILSP